MAHGSTEHAQLEAEDSRPPDILQMRSTAARALAEAPNDEDLDTLASTLRGHMQLLIPELEQLAGRRNDLAAISARACIKEARGKLRISNSSEVPAIQVSLVQKLARSVDALCRHYATLGGVQ